MKLKWKKLENQTGHEAGRQLLAELYREETGEDLPRIFLTEQGKPYFEQGVWQFSISHTDCHAFCALSREAIGIDAEEMDRKIDQRIGVRFLSEGERLRLEAAPDKTAALLRFWVLKESLAKLTGKGIGNWIKNTDFDPNDERITCIDGCYVAVLEGEEYAV